ncbi:glutathionylspermidine synthase family protein [Paenarthrobacter sp. S56]|uniref:glutathionylspermidine synthase family protein n=1 Tax=Paenarthrobacter sp. S56 TaxID=3138179 RepID=UPI00321A38F2
MPDGRKIEYWNESAYYEFTMDEVEALENTAEDMHRMCLEAAKYLATGAMGDIGIGRQALDLAAESLQAGDMDIYGRFDFIYDGRGGPAKMLEYNADTPTGLIEAAVAQWFWLQDVFPEKDQWNGIHEALIRQWKKLQFRTGMSTLHVAHSEAEESGEDWMTAAYMRDVASQGGLDHHWHQHVGHRLGPEPEPVRGPGQLHDQHHVQAVPVGTDDEGTVRAPPADQGA